jgi:hypothetical protein
MRYAMKAYAIPSPDKPDGRVGSAPVVIQDVYPLDAAADAISAFQAGTRGKLVLRVSEG